MHAAARLRDPIRVENLWAALLATLPAVVAWALGSRGTLEARLLKRAGADAALATSLHPSPESRRLRTAARRDVRQALELRQTSAPFRELVWAAILVSAGFVIIPPYLSAFPSATDSRLSTVFWIAIWLVYGAMAIALWALTVRVNMKRRRITRQD